MSSNELPSDLNETFSLLMQLFKIIGFNIFDDPNKSFIRKYALLIFITVMSMVMTSLVIMYVMMELSRSSFSNYADTIPVAIAFTQDVAGFLSLIYKKNEMKALIYDIAELWPTDLGGNKIKEEIKKNWLRRMAFFTRANALAFLLAIVVFFTPVLILTLYDQYAKDGTVFVFPYKIYYFCEDNTTLYSYLLVLVFEMIFGTCLHMLAHAPCNLMLTMLSCNISMMMRWLQIDLENVLEVSDGRTVFDEDKLKNIVKVHQKLLRICEKLNECFGIVIFASVVSSSLIIGCFAFLTLATDRKHIVTTIVVSFEILNVSWPGQLLADMSYGIAEAAYRTQWYDSDLKFKKYIYLIILRSQKPVQLSVLGFSNLTLELFAKVLSSAWSYLSILNVAYSNRN